MPRYELSCGRRWSERHPRASATTTTTPGDPYTPPPASILSNFTLLVGAKCWREGVESWRSRSRVQWTVADGAEPNIRVYTWNPSSFTSSSLPWSRGGGRSRDERFNSWPTKQKGPPPPPSAAVMSPMSVNFAPNNPLSHKNLFTKKKYRFPR